MREYLPLLIVCAVIGVFTILFLAAYAVLKRKTKEETSERHMLSLIHISEPTRRS